MTESKNPRLTPESAKSVADKVIEGKVVPKKVPRVEDIEGQTQALVGAMASALLTATDTPITIDSATIGKVCTQLVAYGVRQTKHFNPAAVYAPAWITDGVRQHSVDIPAQPQHTEAAPVVARTDVAPAPPKRIAKHARAVRR